MRSTILILLLITAFELPAQSIRLLFADRKYPEVVKQFAEKEKELDEEELYLLGFSFFQSGEDEKAIHFYDKAIAKGFDSAFVHFYKGIAYRYLDKMENALAAFDKAIQLDSLQQQYVCEKAFTFYRMEKYDLALAAYEKAKKLPDTYQAPWYMIPHIWYVQGKDEEALKGLYEGLEHIARDNEYYTKTLLEIGKIERLYKKDFVKSAVAYQKILKEDGTHFEACKRLTIVYNQLGQKNSADSLFRILRNLYLENKLPEEDMKFKRVQIAEYFWNDRVIMVYKNFDPPAKVPDIMLTGYLLDKKGEKVERIFQSEKTFEFTKDSPKHLLCERGLQKGRYNYGIGWKTEEISPSAFFELIQQVLDGKIKPMAASGF
ncbi:MAG TPA: hypothetical protein VF476_18610 [Chitinophagaceae bacterium]